MSVQILHGDALELLPTLSGLDACVCDPPYHLTDVGRSIQYRRNGDGTDRTKQRNYIERGFMGKQWDGGDIALRPETWALVLQALKPGAHLLAFGGTRTFHRMACAIEDAGFEIRDTIMWVYGSGFPKSHDVSKGIDRQAGAVREVIGRRKTATGISMQGETPGSTFADDNYAWANEVAVTAPATPEAAAWSGWGTALKPAWEPIIVARRPLVGTVAQNVLKHGTGAINVDGCRVTTDEAWESSGKLTGGLAQHDYGNGLNNAGRSSAHTAGRWPANLCLSFPETQYTRRSDVTTAQKQELYRWFHENA